MKTSRSCGLRVELIYWQNKMNDISQKFKIYCYMIKFYGLCLNLSITSKTPRNLCSDSLNVWQKNIQILKKQDRNKQLVLRVLQKWLNSSLEEKNEKTKERLKSKDARKIFHQKGNLTIIWNIYLRCCVHQNNHRNKCSLVLKLKYILKKDHYKDFLSPHL